MAVRWPLDRGFVGNAPSGATTVIVASPSPPWVFVGTMLNFQPELGAVLLEDNGGVTLLDMSSNVQLPQLWKGTPEYPLFVTGVGQGVSVNNGTGSGILVSIRGLFVNLGSL